MDDSRLAELDALCAAATPGPWAWDDHSYDDGQPAILLSTYHGPELPGFPMADDGSANEDGTPDLLLEKGVLLERISPEASSFCETPLGGDLAFIAAARTALPELIAEVRRLRAELASAELQLSGFSEWAGQQTGE